MILKLCLRINFLKKRIESEVKVKMKIATLNRGKETKYLNQYPLIDEEDIYQHDHLKEGI